MDESSSSSQLSTLPKRLRRSRLLDPVALTSSCFASKGLVDSCLCSGPSPTCYGPTSVWISAVGLGIRPCVGSPRVDEATC